MITESDAEPEAVARLERRLGAADDGARSADGRAQISAICASGGVVMAVRLTRRLSAFCGEAGLVHDVLRAGLHRPGRDHRLRCDLAAGHVRGDQHRDVLPPGTPGHRRSVARVYGELRQHRRGPGRPMSRRRLQLVL
jgi:hypothetical protein